MDSSERIAELRAAVIRIFSLTEGGSLVGDEAAQVDRWLEAHGPHLTEFELLQADELITQLRSQLQVSYRVLAGELMEVRERRRALFGYASLRPMTVAQRLNRRA